RPRPDEAGARGRDRPRAARSRAGARRHSCAGRATRGGDRRRVRALRRGARHRRPLLLVLRPATGPPSARQRPDMTVAPSLQDADTEPAEGACARCGAPLAADQEWCLECGGARTVIHPTPNRRVPVVIIGLVVAAALTAFVLVLAKLSSDVNQRAAR